MFRHFGAEKQNKQKNLNWSNVDSLCILCYYRQMFLLFCPPHLYQQESAKQQETLLFQDTQEKYLGLQLMINFLDESIYCQKIVKKCWSVFLKTKDDILKFSLPS